MECIIQRTRLVKHCKADKAEFVLNSGSSKTSRKSEAICRGGFLKAPQPKAPSTSESCPAQGKAKHGAYLVESTFHTLLGHMIAVGHIGPVDSRYCYKTYLERLGQ